MSSIPLSPKHGVNPSLLLCPLCGKDTGVALLGRLPQDREAPRKIMDQEYCKECQEHAKIGVILVEAQVGGGMVHLLGGYWVVKEEAARKLLQGEAGEQALKRRAAYIPPEVVTHLGLRKSDAPKS